MNDTPNPTQPDAEPDPAAPHVDELAALQEQLAATQAALEAEQRKTQAANGTLARPAGSLDLSDKSLEDREALYADWPARGGSSDVPQPWDHRALGLQAEVNELTQNGGPNNVTPIVIAHGRPILTSGSTDQSVHELGRILGHLGFTNSVSDGQNAYGAVDHTIMNAVHAFRAAFGVEEDPTGFGGDNPDGRRLAASHIGPWTWEAILRAGARELPKIARGLAHI